MTGYGRSRGRTTGRVDHAAGVQEQVEALYSEHGARVLGYLARRVTPVEDAADLLSEVLLVTWRRRHTLPASPQDVLWMFGVARNVLANHRRATHRRQAAAEHLAQLLTCSRHDAGIDLRDQVDIEFDLRRALGGLGDLDREIVTLNTWEGLTSAEIGTVLDMPAATVRSRLARARHRLRIHLDTSGRTPASGPVPRPTLEPAVPTSASGTH